MKPFDISPEQRELLIRDAERYELVARGVREIAEFGRPSDIALASSPVIEGWGFEALVGNELVGAWKPAGKPTLVAGRAGRAILNAADLSAVLTEQGWFRLGAPDESRARTTELPR